MEDIKTKVLEAALTVFMRYGVARTRMSDIAAQAGVARQTLYALFKNKDDILCAAIRYYSALSLADIRAAWAQQHRLGDKLDTYYAHAILSSYAMLSASTDARDMIGGFNDVGKAETEIAQAHKIDAWVEILTGHLEPDDQDAAQKLAAFIVLSSIGLRDQAQSEAQLRALLEVQKQGILAQVR